MPLQKHVASGTGRCKLRVFKLFLRQYAYCSEHNSFEAVPAMPAQIPVLLCDALEALQAISQGTLRSQAISHGALDIQAISHGALPLVKVHCTCRPLVKVHYTHRPSVKVHCTHRPSVQVHCTHGSLVKVHCTYRPSVKVHCTEPYIRELVLCIVSSTTCM